LFRCSAETLIEIAADPKHLGAEIGFFSVLHTWNQKLQHHPHVHCVAAAGGLSRNHTHWVRAHHNKYFLPVGVLSKVFRGKFVAALQQAHASGQLQFRGLLRGLSQPRLFRSLVRQLFALRWVVYCEPAFGGPEQVLRYLGAYTHRVAVSQRRLVSFVDDKVTFRWRDSAHKNQQRLRLCLSMSSCVASCCMCCRVASSASGTTAPWPAAAAVRWYRFANICFLTASSPRRMRQ
jgi:hypothetical protein